MRQMVTIKVEKYSSPLGPLYYVNGVYRESIDLVIEEVQELLEPDRNDDGLREIPSGNHW